MNMTPETKAAIFFGLFAISGSFQIGMGLAVWIKSLFGPLSTLYGGIHILSGLLAWGWACFSEGHPELYEKEEK